MALSASEAAKAAGLKSLAEASRIGRTPRSTLDDWYWSKPETFTAYILGCAEMKRRRQGATGTEALKTLLNTP